MAGLKNVEHYGKYDSMMTANWAWSHTEHTDRHFYFTQEFTEIIFADSNGQRV